MRTTLVILSDLKTWWLSKCCYRTYALRAVERENASCTKGRGSRAMIRDCELR